METQNEEWRPIKGYHYQVSSLGRVKRVGPSIGGAKVGRVLRHWQHKSGYVYVKLFHRNIGTTMTVHRLVAAAFIGERPAGHVINHIDAIKTNNAATNLEYIRQADNLRHADELGLMESCKKRRFGAETRTA